MTISPNFQVGPASDRAALIQSLKVLKKCNPLSLEKLAVELLENNSHYFTFFRLDLASRVLKIKIQCASHGQIPQKLHQIIGQLFNFAPEKSPTPLLRSEALEQIAKACIAKEFSLNPEVFQECDITQEEVRTEIALQCVAKGSLMMVKKIHRFAIKDENTRLQIATLSLKTNKLMVFAYLKKFDIQSEVGRIALAWALVKANPAAMCQYIKKVGVQDENVRIHIAMHCAADSPNFTIEHLRKFTIQSEKGRIEIAQHLLSIDPINSFTKLKNLAYLTPECFSLACVLALRKNSMIFDQFRKDVEFLAFNDQPLDRLFDQELDTSDVINDFFVTADTMFTAPNQHLAKYSHASPEVQALIGEIIVCGIDVKNDQTQLFQRRWLAGLLTRMHLFKRTPFHFSKWFLSPLSQMRDPVLRWQLTCILIDFENNSTCHPFWQPLAENVKWNLLAIPLFYLQRNWVNANLLNHLAHALMHLHKKKCSRLLDKVNMRLLFTALVELGKNTILNPSAKESVMRRIFYQGNDLLNEQDILRNLSAVNNLMRLEKFYYLEFEGDLPSLFKKAFLQTFPMNNFQGDFLEAFNQRFQNDDHLMPLMKYASGIHSLNDKKALACLSDYMASVLDLTFLERRYSLVSNPHLKTICENRPDLLAQWRAPLKDELSNLRTHSSEQPLLKPQEWLMVKLIHDNHATVNIEEFKAFLTASLSEKRQILEGLSRTASALQKEIRITPAKELQLKQVRYKFLSICCKLAETDPRKESEVNILLKSLYKVIKGQENFSEFQHDLKVLLKNIGSVEIPSQGLYAEVTDDPFSLLNCGTVPGSCQRVDRSPQLNRGLLGYLMDGKIQVAAIKDARGRIIARCMLKILWDGSSPVLFRERIYPDLLPEAHKKILNDLVRQKAERLRLTLVSEDKTHMPYPHALHALGGPAPFEYSDGGNNKVTNGTYTIPKTYIL